MTSAICCVECRSAEVEVVTMWITSVDTEVPIAVMPIQWAIEVARSDECSPLCIQQHIAQITITTLPIVAIYIIITCYSHQIVEVYLVCSLILFICQVQLVCHFISQEQRLVASLFITHCLARCSYRQHCNQGYHHLLHILISYTLIVRHHCFHGQK